MLSTLVPDAPVRVVPDTGFGIGRLLDAKPSQELEELVARLGGERGYVVVKPSAELRDVAGAVRGVLAAARERGLAVVELPFSPSHGDRTGTLPGLGETVSPPDWPGPRLIAEILAGAEAVIAQSFHAGAVATASGVPLYRPPSPPGWKYEALEGHEGVHLLREGSGDGPGSGSYEDFGRRSPAATVRERIAQLSAHWDAVAATARAERRRDAPLTPAALGLIAALPHQLHAHEELLQERSAERERVIAERLHAAEARLAASEAAAAARIENLRSASTALLAQKEDLTTWVARLTDERTEAAARTAALDEVRKPQDRAPRPVADASAAVASAVARAPDRLTCGRRRTSWADGSVAPAQAAQLSRTVFGRQSGGRACAHVQLGYPGLSRLVRQIRADPATPTLQHRLVSRPHPQELATARLEAERRQAA
jgi:hypothetical protein